MLILLLIFIFAIMKKIYKSIMFAVVATMFSGTLSAQNLNSAYFLDGYTYGHQLNPAKD